MSSQILCLRGRNCPDLNTKKPSRPGAGGKRKGCNGDVLRPDQGAVRKGAVARYESPAAPSSLATATPSDCTRVKSLAVGTTLGIIRDMVTPSCPRSYVRK